MSPNAVRFLMYIIGLLCAYTGFVLLMLYDDRLFRLRLTQRHRDQYPDLFPTTDRSSHARTALVAAETRACLGERRSLGLFVIGLLIILCAVINLYAKLVP